MLILEMIRNLSEIYTQNTNKSQISQNSVHLMKKIITWLTKWDDYYT